MKLYNNIIKWIRCGNDCEHCPAGWEEWDCEHTECDAGCYIYGDEWPEPCRLPLPKFIRGFLVRRPKYLQNHQYDDIGEWYEKQEAAEEKIRDAIEDALKYRCICYKRDDGTYYETDRDSEICEIMWKAKAAYDDFLHEPRKTLRQRWAELIKETISRPINFIKSYIMS